MNRDKKSSIPSSFTRGRGISSSVRGGWGNRGGLSTRMSSVTTTHPSKTEESTLAVRKLGLTEELERLEQNITLTLQKIDENFSQAYYVVTMKIMPIVEKYARNSEAVWDGSKFWKQFFEASANVSLSGYAEPDNEEMLEGGDNDNEECGGSIRSGENESSTSECQDATSQLFDDENFVQGNRELLPYSRSVKNTQHHANNRTSFPTNDTLNLRNDQEVTGHNTDNSTILPNSTGVPMDSKTRKPNPVAWGGGTNCTSVSSSNHRTATDGNRISDSSPMTYTPVTPCGDKFGRREDDNGNVYTRIKNSKQTSIEKILSSRRPMLHHVLDQKIRVAATPLTNRSQRTINLLAESPDSPDLIAPQLRSELFASPHGKLNYRPNTTSTGTLAAAAAARTITAPPGVSLLMSTPLRTATAATFSPSRTRSKCPTNIPSELNKRNQPTQNLESGLNSLLMNESTSDVEDEFALDFSPPRTIQFHIPSSRLARTPAREASKRIVEELLLTAGANLTDSVEPDSPSIVHRNLDLSDTF